MPAAQRTAATEKATRKRRPSTPAPPPNGWTKVPHALTRDHDLTDGAYRTLITIRARCYADTTCRLTLAELAAERGCSTDTISRHLGELRQLFGLQISNQQSGGLECEVDDLLNYYDAQGGAKKDRTAWRLERRNELERDASRKRQPRTHSPLILADPPGLTGSQMTADPPGLSAGMTADPPTLATSTIYVKRNNEKEHHGDAKANIPRSESHGHDDVSRIDRANQTGLPNQAQIEAQATPEDAADLRNALVECGVDPGRARTQIDTLVAKVDHNRLRKMIAIWQAQQKQGCPTVWKTIGGALYWVTSDSAEPSAYAEWSAARQAKQQRASRGRAITSADDRAFDNPTDKAARLSVANDAMLEAAWTSVWHQAYAKWDPKSGHTPVQTALKAAAVLPLRDRWESKNIRPVVHGMLWAALEASEKAPEVPVEVMMADAQPRLESAVDALTGAYSGQNEGPPHQARDQAVDDAHGPLASVNEVDEDAYHVSASITASLASVVPGERGQVPDAQRRVEQPVVLHADTVDLAGKRRALEQLRVESAAATQPVEAPQKTNEVPKGPLGWNAEVVQALEDASVRLADNVGVDAAMRWMEHVVADPDMVHMHPYMRPPLVSRRSSVHEGSPPHIPGTSTTLRHGDEFVHAT